LWEFGRWFARLCGFLVRCVVIGLTTLALVLALLIVCFAAFDL
jgi:hypothetical protein